MLLSVLCTFSLLPSRTGVVTQPRSTTTVVSVADGSFVDAPTGPWSISTYTTGTHYHLSYSTMSSGGNPGAYHFDSVTFDASPVHYISYAGIMHLNSNATWNPSTSPYTFSSIDISMDLNSTQAGGVDEWLICYQNGKYYSSNHTWYQPNSNNNGVWYTASGTGIVQNNFNELNLSDFSINTSSHPDFSSSGSTVTFGYMSHGTHPNVGMFSNAYGGTDNWTFTLYGTP